MAFRPDSSGSGGGTGTTDAAGNPTPKPSLYRNPFRAVKNLTAERVDMGVDYAGEGPVYALGPGVITAAGNQWAGAVGAPYPGTWITERLTRGPLAGKDVYVAEDIYDVQVRTGQKVDSSTQLGTLRGGLETGFAAPGSEGTGGTTAAMAAGQASTGGDPGAQPTAYGDAYSKILTSLGAPAGTEAGSPVGSLPGWLQGIIGAIGGPVGGLIGSPVGGALGSISTAIDWLLNPGHWIRIISFIAGGTFVVTGVIILSGIQARVSESVPVIGGAASSVQTSIRLPLGIFLVGSGGVFLFIAFHNLPPGVTDISTLIAYEQEQFANRARTKTKAAA